MTLRDSQSTPLQIYLIQHGETAWAPTWQHTGRSDIPLTLHGMDEARSVGTLLDGTSFSRVLSSPLQRARSTCDLVALDVVPTIESDLAEWNYGDFEGRTTVDIRRERPDWNLLSDGCPNGERPGDVVARADRLIARLRDLTGNVALFSHAQFGGVLTARWIGLPLECATHFPLGTASVSILASDPAHFDVPVIRLWNFTSHVFSRFKLSRLAIQAFTVKERAIQRWENEGGEIPFAELTSDPVGAAPASPVSDPIPAVPPAESSRRLEKLPHIQLAHEKQVLDRKFE